MKESKDRTEQFMHSTTSAANSAPTSMCLSFFSVSLSHLTS